MSIESAKLLSQLDTIADSSWLNPTASRRFFLGASASGLLLAACGRSQEVKIPIGVRRTEGRWSPVEVAGLALSMINERDLEGISRTGQLLLDNQYGRPSLSTESSLFGDALIKFSTLELDQRTLAKSRVTETNSPMTVLIKDKNSEDLQSIQAAKKLILPEVLLNKMWSDQSSDLMVKFSVAKEIFYDIRAIEMATSFYANQAFELPRDKVLVDVVRIYELTRGVDGDAPIGFIADIWAHFLSLPDYLTAKDRGGFSEQDLAIQRGTYDPLANYSINQGLLEKQGDRYTWVVDQPRLRSAMTAVAFDIYDKAKDVVNDLQGFEPK